MQGYSQDPTKYLKSNQENPTIELPKKRANFLTILCRIDVSGARTKPINANAITRYNFIPIKVDDVI